MPYCTRFASLHLLQLGEDGDDNAGQDSRASTGLCIGLTAGMNSTSPRLAKAVGVIKRPAINREHTSVFLLATAITGLVHCLLIAFAMRKVCAEKVGRG